jgi:hypothetical protein
MSKPTKQQIAIDLLEWDEILREVSLRDSEFAERVKALTDRSEITRPGDALTDLRVRLVEEVLTDVSRARLAAVSHARLAADGRFVPWPSRKRRGPPKYAELLLTAFASTRHAEAMIGDLNERHADWCKRFGGRWADRLYWVRAVQSIGPLLWRSVVKALKWAVVISTVRRFLGL